MARILRGRSEPGLVAVRVVSAAVDNMVDSHFTVLPVLGRAGRVVRHRALGGESGKGRARGHCWSRRRRPRRLPFEARPFVPAFRFATCFVVIKSVHGIGRRQLELVDTVAGGCVYIPHRGRHGSWRRGVDGSVALTRLPVEALFRISAGHDAATIEVIELLRDMGWLLLPRGTRH